MMLFAKHGHPRIGRHPDVALPVHADIFHDLRFPSLQGLEVCGRIVEIKAMVGRHEYASVVIGSQVIHLVHAMGKPSFHFAPRSAVTTHQASAHTSIVVLPGDGMATYQAQGCSMTADTSSDALGIAIVHLVEVALPGHHAGIAAAKFCHIRHGRKLLSAKHVDKSLFFSAKQVGSVCHDAPDVALHVLAYPVYAP